MEQIGTEGPQHKTALYPTPGQKIWIGIANQVGRGGIFTGTRAFVVLGTAFYEIFADGTITGRGNVAADLNLAQLSYNGVTGGQILIASGGNAYCFVLGTNAITQVLTGEAHQIGMLDEYFLALNQTNGKLRLSNLNDGTTWDPSQFAFRSAQPDPWAAMVVNPPDIWLIGMNTGDIWFDQGSSPFPLAARTGLNIQYGIIAPFSFQVTGGQLFWLSSNKDGAGMVVMSQGYGPAPISSTDLDTAIASYQRTTRITDAEAMVFQMLGHTFYVLRFPSANATWLYDLTTQKWTELGTWNSLRGDFDTWNPRFHVYAFGMHIVGSATTGTLSLLDVAYNTESDGSIIRRLRRGPVLVRDMQRLSIRRFELLLEPGLGLNDGQGSDPVVMARFSADGGKTWGNERQCGAGKIGQYFKRIYWTRMGSPRMWVPEVWFTDPIPWRIVDALINNDVDMGRPQA